MLGFKGTVIKGQQRGKKLGFPTANTTLTSEIPEGIYLSKTTLESIVYPSLTFIGPAKTYDENVYQAETYILHFDKDIYDQEIGVELIKKIRENQKFETEEKLVKQMKSDTIVAETFFASSAFQNSDK